MLAAVELWVKRDHKAEWAMWESWLHEIATSVERVPGVTTSVRQPSADLSNRTPELVIQWDPAKLGASGQDIFKHLLETEPRINLARSSANSVAVVPYQMQAGDEKVVADRLHAVLAKPPKSDPPPTPAAPSIHVAGVWELQLDFVYGSARHRLVFEQEGARLTGSHEGEFASGDLTGTVAGNRVRFQSSLPTEGQRVSFQFDGAEQGSKLAGTVALGEYGEASWTAERHNYRSGNRRG
jgi:D-glucosaminate-6-phosphate ammonia-lyase